MHFTTVTLALLASLGAEAAPGRRACTGPKVNSATIDLITGFEGFRASPYTDPSGNPTVGYGHLCSNAQCSDVKYPIPLSTADGRALLADDLAPPQNCITLDTAQCVTLNENQYGALVSWAFNEGCGAAKSSTLISRLNNCENPETVIESELPQWVYAGGQRLDGLVRRRAAEVKLSQTATSVGALPAAGC